MRASLVLEANFQLTFIKIEVRLVLERRLAGDILARVHQTVRVEVSHGNRAPRLPGGLVYGALIMQFAVVDERKQARVQILAARFAAVLLLAQTGGCVGLIGAHVIGGGRFHRHAHALIVAQFRQSDHLFACVDLFAERIVEDAVAGIRQIAVGAKITIGAMTNVFLTAATVATAAAVIVAATCRCRRSLLKNYFGIINWKSVNAAAIDCRWVGFLHFIETELNAAQFDDAFRVEEDEKLVL